MKLNVCWVLSNRLQHKRNVMDCPGPQGKARGFNMQLSHLNAIISEWPVGNGTRHEAQRIYPAAHVTNTVRRSSSLAVGTWRRSMKIPLVRVSEFLCCCLRNENTAHDKALVTLKALEQSGGLGRTRAPLIDFNLGSGAFLASCLHS